jgi:hypothetical protein
MKINGWIIGGAVAVVAVVAAVMLRRKPAPPAAAVVAPAAPATPPKADPFASIAGVVTAGLGLYSAGNSNGWW